MAKIDKADMSCARVKQYTASDVSKAERHNERKNETYENMNVIEERIPFNVHFKKPTAPTYMEQLKQMEADGQVSLRGLRRDATLFNEIVIDVNTMYFERNGGYEYAKQFYEEAYRFIVEKFGADNVISAVMHADEINVAATEELGKEVYHYHLHAMVLPVVEKEILWSKRCKDEKLRGTVKEVVNQISHSKKWKSDIPLTDEKGKPLLRKNGKPNFTLRAEETEKQMDALRENLSDIQNQGAANDWMEEFSKRQGLTELDRSVVVALIDKILIHANDVVEIVYRWQDEFSWQLDILRRARLQEVV